MKVLSCNSNLPLAKAIGNYLDIPIVDSEIKRFSDGEIRVEINENVRGNEVFVVQSTSHPCNEHLMELLITIDALKRSSAKRITAVIPYYGYARQDRKPGPRTPISAKLVADLITTAGAHRVLTLDLHAMQIQGFFNIPVDNLFAAPLFARDIREKFRGDTVVVSPDVGGVVRARDLAKRINNAELAIIDKRREKANISEVMNVIGTVEGADCVIIDDIVDTAGTLCNAASALLEKGARSVSAYITHGVLSGTAVERIGSSVLSEMVITDSIKATDVVNGCAKIRQITVAPLLAEAINRINHEMSVSNLFEDR
jgi:ribose-phosphate pyrophosphokinase